MKPGTRFLLAMPVYNEEEYVCRVVSRALRFARHLLVVNDGSTDRTPQRLASFSHVDVINHETNLGYGRSLIDAFTYAITRGYDYVVTMDCDEQHEPEAIPRFLAEMPDYDIVSGSRYQWDWGEDDPPPPERRRVNLAVSRILTDLTGYEMTDAFCGQKAYRVSALKRLTLTEAGYAMPLELWVQAAAAGLTVKEIPVRRIYKDFSRTFGGDLDDADRRLAHYREVIERARRAAGLPEPVASSGAESDRAACQTCCTSLGEGSGSRSGGCCRC